MWTPRRIFIGLVGLLCCAAGYFCYAQALGELNGLPPLPEKYRPQTSTGDRPTPTGGLSSLEKKVARAFGGPNCPELRYPIKTEMRKNNVLICAHRFEILNSGERDGWVELSPLSMATFGERSGPEALEEINTIYCDLAYIKFDQPIRSMSDFGGAKMTVVELHAIPEAQLRDTRKGRVRLLNNRKTYDPNDDLEMVTPGPVYYEAEPQAGQPHIYTHTEVHIFDHLNTSLPEPDHTVPRDPTVKGIGLRIFLVQKPKDAPQPKTPGKTAKAKSNTEKTPLNGVESIALDNTVEMNIWTDYNSSFVAPGSGVAPPKPKTPIAKKDNDALGKRLLQIRTNGPFRYDVQHEIAHFEKPAISKPGVVEHVTVTRSGKVGEQDLLDCEYLDVQMKRKQSPAKDSPTAKKADSKPGDSNLEIKSIKAWGETVVVASDAENLHATGSELIHDAEARITILKGSPSRQVQAVKEGNLLRGSEMHLFGDGKQISQAHILGVGSIGFGDLDSKTGEFQKQANWTDRLVYSRIIENNQPIDVFTIIGKDGNRAAFKDVSSGKLQQLEGEQLKVWVKPADEQKGKTKSDKPPAKKSSNAKGSQSETSAGARVTRVEGTGFVRSTSPDLIIRHADYLNVLFQDIAKLQRPSKSDPFNPLSPAPKPGPATPPLGAVVPAPFPRVVDGNGPVVIGPVPRVLDLIKGPAVSGPAPRVIDPKGPAVAKKEPPKKEEEKPKPPMIVTARSIETWINRDPEGHTEVDRIHMEGDVEAHQDPADGKQGMDIAGQTVDVHGYAEGYKLTVFGDNSNKTKPKWGVVRFDKLTMFGFDIVIDQRTDTAVIKNEGSMEIMSGSDLEGKKLEQATVVTIYWKHRMDFHGGEKLIEYHGNVQAYEKGSRCKCEWMQILLDKPVYLNSERREKARAAAAARPGVKPKDKDKDPESDVQIDTVMCFHAPKDEDIPKPKVQQPVTVVQEVEENGKVVRFQSIQAPEVVMVNTPLGDSKFRRDVTATSSATLPGTVRIFQAGQKDLADTGKKDKPEPKKTEMVQAKGELRENEEMKLTIIQFGEKMWAEDLRKRAKFWTNVRAVHLPADKPNIAVDLREGDIPKGAMYMECRDTLEVYSTVQREKGPNGKEIDVSYQEMIGVGNVRVRKQGEFFGDADRVAYSELKGTITLYGTDKNPASVSQSQGQGIPNRTYSGRTLIYHIKDRTVESVGGVQIKN